MNVTLPSQALVLMISLVFFQYEENDIYIKRMYQKPLRRLLVKRQTKIVNYLYGNHILCGALLTTYTRMVTNIMPPYPTMDSNYQILCSLRLPFYLSESTINKQYFLRSLAIIWVFKVGDEVCKVGNSEGPLYDTCMPTGSQSNFSSMVTSTFKD